MILPRSNRLRLSRGHAAGLACALVGAALGAGAQSDSMDTFGGDPSRNSFLWIPADANDWTRHFRIGAMAGLNLSANFTMNGRFNISGNNAGAGVYNDGYVLTDQTGNAGGLTGFWGYNNASQYNAAAQTLDFHSATSFSATGSSKDDGGPFPGFDMAYGDNLWYWKHARVGWELGFGLLPVNIKDTHPMAATVNQSTYTFGTDGIVVPQAPYRGGASGQGEPVIADTPQSTSYDTLSRGTVTGSRSLDMMVYTVRLGPSFYWDLNDYFGVSFGAGPALGIVSGNYAYNETIAAGGSTAHNTGAFSTTQVVFGGYVNGTFLYHVINDADLYLSAEYMPLGSVSMSQGGRTGKLNLGGQVYISAGINWPF